ncbi:cathelicidin-2-like [Anolis sagrei]|uniref:cathelicidin-2-like n=1 Tax=Anolis sagrei TaxID=38937 RepID=UPI003520783E
MEKACTLLFFLGVAMAAPTLRSPISYDQAVASAVDTYNREQKPEFLFQLLESEPQPDWKTTGEVTQPLKFSIKETECRSTDKMNGTNCNFKEKGVDKDCSGFYSTQQNPPAIIVQCEDVEQELSRITRGRWGRFWRGTKRFVKKHGVSIALAGLRFVG